MPHIILVADVTMILADQLGNALMPIGDELGDLQVFVFEELQGPTASLYLAPSRILDLITLK